MIKTITYITVPLDDIEAFKRTYNVTTSELLQDERILNDIETHVMFGSSNITLNQIKVLQEKYPEVEFTESPPQFFSKKEEMVDGK